MSLSSRPPVAARTSGTTGSLADSLAMFNPQYLGNDIVSNSLAAGVMQFTGLDQYFAPQGGDGMIMTGLRDGLYTTAVNHAGTGMAARMWVPSLRVFGG